MTVREQVFGPTKARIPPWDRVFARPRLFGYVSLLAVPMVAGALLARPLAGAPESVVIGGLLLSFAFGWWPLAWLVFRPAALTASLLGIAGTLLLVVQPSPAELDALDWLW